MKHDINYNDRESSLKITAKQTYEWIKTGLWNLKTFEIWLDHKICDAEYKAKYGELTQE